MLTPENPFNQTPFRANDPLAVGFMTQGQMGYMPQQQYLTPSEYGAFRTLPQTNQLHLPYQRPGFFQSMVHANGGTFAGIPMPTYNPSANIMHRQAMATRYLQDNRAAWGGAAADALIGGGLMMAGPAGVAAGLLMPSIGGYHSDVQGNMRRMQMQSMPKIVSGPDVSGMGMGFSAHKALSLEKFVRSSAASDPFMKSEDYRTIIQKGMENNLFDFDNTVDSYKKTTKRLRKQIDIMREISENKDMESIMKDLKRLQDMGARGDVTSGIIRQEGMFAKMTGMRHSEMVNSYGQQGAFIYSQNGMTNYQGSLASMATAAQVAMSQRMGLISAGELSRHGGISGLTQELVEGGARGLQQQKNLLLPFLSTDNFTKIDEKALSKLMKGEVNYKEAALLGGPKVTSAENMTKYLSEEKNLMQQLQDKLGPINMQILQAKIASDYGKDLGIKDPTQAMAAGFRSYWGYDNEQSKILATNFTNDEYLKGIQDNLRREIQGMHLKGAEQRKTEDFYSFFTSIKESTHNLANPYFSWRAGVEEKNDQAERMKSGQFGGHYGGNVNSRGFVRRITKPGSATGDPSDFDMNDVTDVSRKYEQNSHGVASIGYDSAGRTSYGPNQVTAANMEGLMEWAADNGYDNFVNNFEDVEHWDTGSDKGYAPDKFRAYATANPDEVLKISKGYIKATHYDPLLKNIKEQMPELYEQIMNNPALQKAIYSMSVQHSPEGVMHILKKAYSGGMSDEDLATSIYENRGEYVSGLKSLTTREKAGVLARYKRELPDILAVIAEHQGKGTEELQAAAFTLDDDVKRNYDAYSSELKKTDPFSSMSFSLTGHDKKEAAWRLSKASKMTDEAYNSAISKLGVSGAALKLNVTEVMGDEDFDDINDEHFRVILKRLGKSDEEIEELIKDKDVRNALMKEYAAQNVEQSQRANDIVREMQEEKKTQRYKKLDTIFNEIKSGISDSVGGRDNATRLLQLNSKNADSFGLAHLQTLIDSANRDPGNPGRQRAVFEAAKALGISEEEVAIALKQGDISTLTSFGLSKEELTDITKIGREGAKNNANFKSMESKINAHLLLEGSEAGRDMLLKHGLSTEDYDEDSEIDSLLKTSKDDKLTTFLQMMKAAPADKRKDEGFVTTALARSMGSGTKTVEGGAALSEEEKTVDAHKSAIEALDSMMKNNTSGLNRTADELEKLNSMLAGKGKQYVIDSVKPH